MLWMVCLQVVHMELGLEGGHNQFVLSDIRSIELEPADSIIDVGVPSEAVGLQIKYLHVSVVVSGSDASFFLVVGVSEGNSPAVWLDVFLCRWLK